jgi:SAM-dependent methyltransferase
VSRATPAGRPPAWHIALVSGSVLVLELAFIRAIPAEVRAISYFTNLVLMAAFFGLGLGCLWHRARRLDVLLPIGLAVVAGFVLATRGLVVFDTAESVHYWLEHDRPVGVAPDLPLFPVALFAFAAVATPFVALGQRLVQTMSPHPRLVGYGWDILGSLLGTVLFGVASALRVPPWVWPPLLALAWAAVLLRTWLSRALHVAAGALFVLFASAPYPSTWSPYYLVQHQVEPEGVRVWVNSSFHQLGLDLDPKKADLAELREHVLEKFGRPYRMYRTLHGGAAPERVLVLGAGTGNDVNVALANGAAHVTAVEIDPVILELGRAKNATRPYADPRVATVVDDARHFLGSTSERFDLVVFGTLDSQTLLSSQANLRLENYVYTEESFRSASAVVTERGMVVALYSVFKPWLTGRLYRTFCGQFAGHCVLERSDPFLFDTMLVGAPRLPELRGDPALDRAYADALPSTDDWPFLYLERPTIAPVYVKLVIAVLALVATVLVVFRRHGGGAGGGLHFLLLGMGFTLMESAAVVRLALLFGSTWVVNAVVFSAVLAMVFLANLAVQRGRAPRLGLAWALVLAGVALDFVVAPGWLVGLAAPLRALVAAALVGVPVFGASVCFSRLFDAEAAPGPALGVNLVGAMAGGFAEYASMLFGMRSVWLVVFAVYALAWLTSRRAASVAPARLAA